MAETDPGRANLTPAPTPDKPVRDAAPFLRACPAGGLLGLDPGRRRIGVAGCDPTRLAVAPLETVRRSRWRDDLQRLRALTEERAATGIVLGLPLNMDGTEGPRAQSAARMGRNLAWGLGLPVLLWDERLSSFEAEDRMRAEGIDRNERARRIDAVAACVILRDALNAFERLRRARRPAAASPSYP